MGQSAVCFYLFIIFHAVQYRVIFLTGPPLKISLDWPPKKRPAGPPPTLKKF